MDPSNSPIPSMKEVAEACGVHPSTVSRALRNDTSLPLATRKRIQKRAQAMGYRPHPLVSALIAMRRSRTVAQFRATIALVQFQGVPGQTPKLYEIGARRAAESRGYHLETFTLGASALRPQRLDAILRARNIPGVIIGPLPEGHGHFDLEWSNLCTVALEYTYAPAIFDRVVHDGYDGMQQVIRECRRRGIQRIGILISPIAHERTEQKITAAYWTSEETRGIAAAIPPLIIPAWDRTAVDAWYERHRPDAVVVSNTYLHPVQKWIAARRLRLARDIDLINLNTEPKGPVAGIFQNAEIIGQTAALMVINRITHNDRGLPQHPLTVHLHGEWVEGTTIRAPRSPASTPSRKPARLP